jgi:hypothetical protein
MNRSSLPLRYSLECRSCPSTQLLSTPESGVDGIAATAQQVPYVKDALLGVDLLVLPLCLAFGFTGMAFSVLDVLLLLKGDNIISLFHVAGISEWMTYLGVVM